jgi:putative transposase
MPYRRIPLQAENFYHIYNRGNNRQNIFFEYENYIHFLRLMRKHLVTKGVDILAYCLMPNHYHFLVYLRDDNLSEAMQAFSVAYTKAINKRFDRSGALFQGRFQSVHVNEPNYLIHLSRYIHLNPVTAGFVNRPEEWAFSSYLEYAGLRSGMLPQTEYLKLQFQDEKTCEELSLAEPLPWRIDDNLHSLLLDF